jgi:cell division septation protein DedD
MPAPAASRSLIFRVAAAAALLALLSPSRLLAAPVLVVDGIIGTASADLLGETRPLAAGDVIREREVIRTGRDSHLSLVFASEGLLELGPDARLAIEKLPLSPSASDLRSLVSLNSGYLRVLWTPATERVAGWPFHLFFGGHRSTLQPGEYFFERRLGSLRTCVASGQLTVTAIAGDGVEQLKADACYDLHAADDAKRRPRTQANWEAVRREFTTTPSNRPPPAAPVPVIVASEAIPVPAPVQTPAPVAAVAAIRPPPAPIAKTAPGPSQAPKPATRPDSVPTTAISPPAPATAPTGQPAGWTLLLGSYADPGNAAQVAAKLRGAGYTPFTRVKDIDGRTWHSVQVRGLPSREVAEAKATEVRTQLRIDPVKVVLLP